jgi:exopolysaccharide biosynthesis protein
MTVVVRHNSAVRVVEGDVAIPKDGFVINFRGDSGPQAALFPLGAIVSYTVSRKSEHNEDAWQDVQEAVGAGPRLLTDGAVTYAPEAEGFSSPKILSLGGLRSAIGVTRDGKVLLVTVSGPTMAQLAQVMLKLGAVHAMNLDGGASSGLYCKGSMLTTPGRELSNALVFVKK